MAGAQTGCRGTLPTRPWLRSQYLAYTLGVPLDLKSLTHRFVAPFHSCIYIPSYLSEDLDPVTMYSSVLQRIPPPKHISDMAFGRPSVL